MPNFKFTEKHFRTFMFLQEPLEFFFALFKYNSTHFETIWKEGFWKESFCFSGSSKNHRFQNGACFRKIAFGSFNGNDYWFSGKAIKPVTIARYSFRSPCRVLTEEGLYRKSFTSPSDWNPTSVLAQESHFSRRKPFLVHCMHRSNPTTLATITAFHKMQMH